MRIVCDHELWPIEKVIPYHANIKKHPEAQINKLASMIAEYGWDVPLVSDAAGVLIKGHGRLEAAKKLGLTEVPVIVRTDLSPAQVKAARIADNKVAESEWDLDNLKLEMDELRELDFDLDLTGFENFFPDSGEPGSGSGTGEGGDEPYTKKIKAPIYEPTGEKPSIADLYDTAKAKKLLAEIEGSHLPEEEKEFLRHAAARHVVFNYAAIAEYYAHSEAPTQELMEDSALVIIDFNKAIENGFVQLSENLAGVYRNEPQ